MRPSQPRGAFDCYLLGAVRHFLANQHDRGQAAKRGGGEIPVPLDPGTASTTVVQIPYSAGSVPVAFFDRHWALTVIDRALKALQAELAASGKEAYYETLKPWLLGDIESLSQAELGCQLGLTEGAVKVAIHRLRKQFRELVKAEVVQTLEDPAQVQEELRYLVEALSQTTEQVGLG